ncbi:MAG: energy transducer TonB [Candidatus Omnitrophota bacterium]|nr:MAG: energy transducer TonB [Candidatus Omnitrophota bacterium]
MLSDKVFQAAFLVSFVIHGLAFIGTPHFNIAAPDKKPAQMEIVYLKSFPHNNDKPKPALARREEASDVLSKLPLKKPAPPPFINDESLIGQERRSQLRASEFTNLARMRPEIIKPDIIAIKKKITLPPLDPGKITSNSYMSYYQIVREKIKRSAYQNYIRNDTGDVYLSFIIAGDGSLTEVKLHDDKSAGGSYLREVALRSIRNSAPFPPFPKELDYPQLSFNIIISFSIE